MAAPIRNCNVSQDIEILKNLIRRVESSDGCNSEQLLPDFYAEHVTLAMNRERRKQALVRVLHLIRQDLEREKRGREGLETLHRAFIATPAFAADESTQNVTEKLHHVRLLFLKILISCSKSYLFIYFFIDAFYVSISRGSKVQSWRNISRS